jgi:hypothetical protein
MDVHQRTCAFFDRSIVFPLFDIGQVRLGLRALRRPRSPTAAQPLARRVGGGGDHRGGAHHQHARPAAAGAGVHAIASARRTTDSLDFIAPGTRDTEHIYHRRTLSVMCVLSMFRSRMSRSSHCSSLSCSLAVEGARVSLPFTNRDRCGGLDRVGGRRYRFLNCPSLAWRP